MSACYSHLQTPKKLFHGTRGRANHDRGHTHAVRMCKALMGDDALAPIFPDIHPAERRRFLAARDGNLEEAVHLVRRAGDALGLVEDPAMETPDAALVRWTVDDHLDGPLTDLSFLARIRDQRLSSEALLQTVEGLLESLEDESRAPKDSG